MEDSNLSEGHEDFIVLPSQDESQVVGLNEAVACLPALQGSSIMEEKIEKPADPNEEKEGDMDRAPTQPEYIAVKLQQQGSSSNSPTDSSFQSKHRSNLGSYDQCEVYETQKSHAKGTRFQFFPFSQEDVFEDKDKEDGHISTPAEHLGSLHLSQQPMLVPETEEDTDNMIPPSQEDYRSTPMIIPGSPTQDDGKQESSETGQDEEEYDFTVTNTFTDNPKGWHAKSMTKKSAVDAEPENKTAEDGTKVTAGENTKETEQPADVSSMDFQAAFEFPTLNDEIRSESLHLHLTESTQASHVSTKRDTEIDLTSSVESVQGKKKASDENVLLATKEPEEQEVIVIQSETLETEHDDIVEDSQNLSLHLTPSQSNPANSQLSLGQRTQADKSQGQRSQGSMSQGSRSQGSHSQGSKTQEGKPRSRRNSREKRLIADVNANPAVIWKDESDSERKLLETKSSKDLSSEKFLDFHLSVPQDTPSEPPDIRIPEHMSQPAPALESGTKSDIAQTKPIDKDEDGSTRQRDDSLLEIDEDISIRRALTISMIHTDSETQTSQAVFKLDRPRIESIVEDDMSDTEDIFMRKKTSKPKPIQEDSEETVAEKGENILEELDTQHISVGTELEEPMVGELNVADVEKKQANENESERKEMSTQTIEKGPGSIEVVDSVVQKVAEYLQTGIQPRSRTSSVCTDLSDTHTGEGSEKGDISLKIPLSQKKEGNKGPKPRTPSGRKGSVDKQVAKSPEEVKHIIQTYSSILSKSKHRRKSGESRIGEEGLPSSQRPNSQAVVPMKRGQLEPRRLSTQSLPAELSKSMIADKGEVQKASRIFDRQISSVSETENTGRFVAVVSQPVTEGGLTMTNFSLMEKSPSLEQRNVDEGPERTKEDDLNERNINVNNSAPKDNELEILNPFESNEASRFQDNNNVRSNPMIENLSTLPIVSAQLTDTFTSSAKRNEASKVTVSNQPLERTENTDFLRKSPAVQLTNISHMVESRSPIVIEKDSVASRKKVRHRQKVLKAVSERNALHKSAHSPGSQSSSGAFTSSTQRFQSKKSSSAGQDPYTFHGSQSQMSPEHERSSRKEFSSRKRRLMHRKSGLKKQRISTDSTERHHVSFQASSPPGQVVSQQSDVTVTTTSSGSLQSVSSSISQKSPSLEPILSPSSNSSRQSVMEDISTRLSGKRLSVDHSLPDTIPLHHSEEDNYKKVTIVTETVEKLYREITTTRKVVGTDGTVLESTVDVKKMEPVTVEENTHKRVQYIYIPSPSRSATSLTSGDLADVSSSLSKSSVSSGSLGSKVSLRSSASLENTEQSESTTLAKSTTAPQITTQKSGELASAEQSTPSLRTGIQSKQTTPAIPSTSAIISDQEVSDVLTPLGSTINKTGSHLHDRTSSVESPKVSDSLFSSSDERKKLITRRTRQQEDANRSEMKEVVGNNESDQDKDSSEIPYQVQSVSSSSVSERGNSLISSTGTIGSRVMAKWKDGFFYPGMLKSSIDRYSRCQVRFDDGDSMFVKINDILLIERLPAGQSVMVLTEEGDFESGLILQQGEDHYQVETDTGTSGSYTFSQVILSADQASFLITDRGSDILIQVPGQAGLPANVGDVSLDNLVDTPRRFTKKMPVFSNVREEEKATEKEPSSRNRKRKLDVMKPKHTSTPTPKGKSEGPTKRRKVDNPYEQTSPIKPPAEAQESARRSPRKAKLGLFRKDTGPLPTKKIFRGITFLLTNVVKSRDQIKQEKSLLKSSSLDTSTDESSQEEDLAAPFDKDHLKAQIEAGEGVVQENLDDKLMAGKKKCVLISSTYQRTIKYLQCLAAGIPCLSHMWIIDSCTQDQLLEQKSYILPAGISLEKRKLMEWKAKDDVFVGVKAIVHSKEAKFVETWTNILQLSKCQVQRQSQYTDTHVIVTDSSCTSAVERHARNKDIPLVSTEWVIQSLITGKTTGFTGHPRYRHDFVTS